MKLAEARSQVVHEVQGLQGCAGHALQDLGCIAALASQDVCASSFSGFAVVFSEVGGNAGLYRVG